MKVLVGGEVPAVGRGCGLGGRRGFLSAAHAVLAVGTICVDEKSTGFKTLL